MGHYKCGSKCGSCSSKGGNEGSSTETYMTYQNPYLSLSLYKRESSTGGVRGTGSNGAGYRTIDSVVGSGNAGAGYSRFNTGENSAAHSGVVKDMYNDYKNSYVGKDFEAFMNDKGYSRNEIGSFGTIRAAPSNGREAVAQLEVRVKGSNESRRLAVNEKYMNTLLGDYFARTHVMMHEDTHAFGVYSEAKVDELMNEFYAQKAEEHGSVQKYLGKGSSEAPAGQYKDAA